MNIAQRRTLRRLRSRSQPLVYALFVTSVLLLLTAIWLGVDLFRAKGELDQARSGFTGVQARIDAGDLDGARQELKGAAAGSRQAGDIVEGIPFDVYSRVPLIGTSVREVRALSRTVDVIGNRVLPGLLNSDLRVPTWTGKLDAAPFRSAQQPLALAETELTAVQAELTRTRRAGIGQLTTARDQLQSSMRKLSDTVREARIAADVVPALSGDDRPRRYFLALQNNAEARSTGGLLGAYAILTVDKGKLTLGRVGQNDELIDPKRPPLSLGAEFDARYGRFASTSTWRSANLSPDVPTVGRLLAALWRQQSGQAVDGVVLLDPVALARLLGATGAVTLSDGSQISEANAVQVLEAEVYVRYPKVSQAPRYAFLAEAAQGAFEALSTRQLDGRKVVQQFARAAASGHLQLWAADRAVQDRLLKSRVSGALLAPGPFLSVVTNDVGGSKLDYYRHRTVSYTAESTGVAVDLGVGPALEEQATVVVQLDNPVPSKLPDYVVARPDDPDAPRGQSHTWVSVYLGARATLLGATLDGKPVQVESQTDRGLSVYSLFIKIEPGAERTLELKVRQPARPDQALLYRQQPLVRNDDVTVTRKGSRQPVEFVYAKP